MKIWQLTTPNNLERQVAPDLKLSDGLSKIKITKALVSESDVSVFSGATRVKYPLVPGRFAVGVVTETAENTFMNKGDRVYLSPATDLETSELGYVFAGKDVNGYYQDFVLADADGAYVLPPSVLDEAAFLIDPIALAERIVDEMDISVGQHVLVLGGGLYGNVLCQILIYHRAVPILADNNKERLARAKKCGIYYTFPNDETLHDNIMNVTGGKLADGAVYLAFNNRSEPSSIFSYVSNGAHVAFCSLDEKPLNVNLEKVLKNNVTVKGISESRDFITTAINLLANKAITFDEFECRYYPEEQLPQVLADYAEKAKTNAPFPEQLDLIKFVF
jgi:(R,R)-butanediol dehydrogenase/meso-butanediol dehydrogenase/diacetyl reductase